MSVNNRRSIKNLLVNKPLQVRITYYFACLFASLLGVLIAFMNIYVNEIRYLVGSVDTVGEEVSLQIDVVLSQLMTTTVAIAVVCLITTLFYSLYVSHKVAGPMNVIVTLIEQIKSGNYNISRELRPADELKPIVDSLKDLAQTLEKKR